MIVGIVKEAGEKRVALNPQVVKKFLSLDNIEVHVEKNISELYADDLYVKSGAKVVENRSEILASSDILFRVNSPSLDELNQMKAGSLSISHMDPYNNRELVETLRDKKINSMSMEMIPRTTLAQKMDSLSSQASLAGYVAVIKGADKMNKIFPMMMTPSGTIAPARVFIIGAGVAGLQAIATAKRLGARVEAYDTRAVVEEQVESLGAKFIKVDIGETGQTKDGYAKALSEEQLKMQQEAMRKSCVNADLIITTAKLFGRKAPVIVTDDILKDMKKDSVIVDLAAGTGGNVEGVKVDEITTIHGVHIIGIDNLPEEVSLNASEMYANNLYNLFTHFYDKEKKIFEYNMDDEIMQGALITYEGKLVNSNLKKVWGE